METKKKVIPIIAMDHISKQYSTGVEALSDVIPEKDWCGISGFSSIKE